MMNTGKSDRSRYCEIEKWGPHDGKYMVSDLSDIKWWKKNGGWDGSNACNDVRGSDGQLWHPDVTEDERLYVFIPDSGGRILLEYEAVVKPLSLLNLRPTT
jgi:hypothetical protein